MLFRLAMAESPVGNSANTAARLRDRIACNQAAHREFPRFVLEVLDARAEDSALEIGPGLGMQFVPVAERVDHSVQVDVERCLELVREAAEVAAMTRGERILRSMDEGRDLI